jgi:hypothetical protein
MHLSNVFPNVSREKAVLRQTATGSRFVLDSPLFSYKIKLWVKTHVFRRPCRQNAQDESDRQKTKEEPLQGQNMRVFCIGPAGEHLSRIANIINKRRALNREGLGAGMGTQQYPPGLSSPS